MTYTSKPWQSYQKVATTTAAPGQLVLMLYDGAVRFLEQALKGFQLEDPGEFNLAINNNVVLIVAICNIIGDPIGKSFAYQIMVETI